MLKRILKRVSALCMLSGLLLLVGTCGAADAGTITTVTLLHRGTAALVLLGAGYIGLKIGGYDYV